MNAQRTMGVDYGSVRIGIALGDEGGRFAFAHSVLANNEQVLGAIVQLIQAERVATVVIGDSRDFAGEENTIMSRVKALGDALKKNTGCEIVYENETFTTQHARRAHEQKEKTRRPQGKEVVDAEAAALILQAYLDKRHRVT